MTNRHLFLVIAAYVFVLFSSISSKRKEENFPINTYAIINILCVQFPGNVVMSVVYLITTLRSKRKDNSFR